MAKHDKMEENSGEAPPKKIKGPKKKKKPKDFRESTILSSIQLIVNVLAGALISYVYKETDVKTP